MSVHSPTNPVGNDHELANAVIGGASSDSEKTVASEDPEPTIEQVATPPPPPDGGYGWGKPYSMPYSSFVQSFGHGEMLGAILDLGIPKVFSVLLASGYSRPFIIPHCYSANLLKVCVACAFLINAHTWGVNSVGRSSFTAALAPPC